MSKLLKQPNAPQMKFQFARMAEEKNQKTSSWRQISEG
jgi:hypothetical protein